jgi:hexosaminidase
VHSHADVRAVVEAARLRGIRVVPELDMPAHAASWAHADPDAVVLCPNRVSQDAEGLEHGMDKAALHPLSERTYQLADALLTELAGLFPDEYVHLGGDEVDGECWLEDSIIQKWAEAHGVGWKERLVAKFSARVLRRAEQLGKRPVLWDEAVEMAPHLPAAFSPQQPPQLTIDAWRDWEHAEGQERWRSALAAGHQVVWSSLSWYLDLPANRWESIYSLQLPTAPPASFLGGEASGWSESADPTNVQQRSLTRLAAAAEVLWSGTPSQLTVAKQRLASVRCRMLRRGLQAEPVIPDYCAVPARTCSPAASPALPVTWLHGPGPLPAVGTEFGQTAWQIVAAASLALNAALLCAMLLARRSKAGSGRARNGEKDR